MTKYSRKESSEKPYSKKYFPENEYSSVTTIPQEESDDKYSIPEKRKFTFAEIAKKYRKAKNVAKSK